ncbi:hypothetical protein SCANM63S_06163 [Streptomyces canarius]
MYHLPPIRCSSGAQMWAPIGPVGCARQITDSSAAPRPFRVRARRRTMRSYSGTVAVK